MGNAVKKSFIVASFTTIIICALALVYTTNFCTVQASTEVNDIPNPSVPEFTLKSVDYSYDVPPTYGIDQFTGENVITQSGYHVDNQSVAFKIKNQPFTSYNDSSGNIINLYFNFRFKGNFGSEWRYYPFSESGQGTVKYSTLFYLLTDQSPKLPASNSEYTDIALGLPFLFAGDTPSVGSQVDFQVQALIGHIDSIGDGFSGFTGQTSDWSNIQTITVGESQIPTPSPAATPTSTPTPSQEPQQTDQTEIIVGAVITVVVLGAGLGLLIYLIKRK